LLKFIQEERVKEIITQSASDMRNVFQNAVAGLEIELQACRSRISGEEDKIVKIKEEQHQIDLALDQIKNDKMFKLDELVEYSSSVIEDAIMEAKDRVMNRIGDYSLETTTLSRLITSEVQRKFIGAIRKINAKVLQILAERMEAVQPVLKDSMEPLKQELVQIQRNEEHVIKFGTLLRDGGFFGTIGGPVIGILIYQIEVTKWFTFASHALLTASCVTIPTVILSVVAIYLSNILKKNAEKRRHIKTTMAIENTFDELLEDSLSGLSGNLENFYNQIVDTAISKQAEEKQKLDAILSESNMGSLKERIKTLEVDGEIVRNYIADLNTFVEV